jgi:hypothetical protein
LRRVAVVTRLRDAFALRHALHHPRYAFRLPLFIDCLLPLLSAIAEAEFSAADADTPADCHDAIISRHFHFAFADIRLSSA